MSDNDLEKIRMKKAEMLLKIQSMPKTIVKVANPDEFNKLTSEILDKIIIIDFWAVWCGPCMSFAPVFEKLQKEYTSDFVFAKVNVDDNPSIAQQFRITGIPTTLFIKNGKPIHKVVGAMNYESMKQILEKFKNNS